MFKYAKKDITFAKKAFGIGYLGPFAPLVVYRLCDYMLNKYKDDRANEDKEFVYDTLKDLIERLKQNGGKFIIGDHFTYADIVLVASMKSV